MIHKEDRRTVTTGEISWDEVSIPSFAWSNSQDCRRNAFSQAVRDIAASTDIAPVLS